MTCSTKSLLSSGWGVRERITRTLSWYVWGLIVCMWVFQPLYKKKLFSVYGSESKPAVMFALQVCFLF